ncbi:hypothetical protein [Actinacidiphila rubida]|uniref:Uncharacterized protein n=1 Tax=Actinacidiphila rubida TaxID=310780 RepID=A0A1H8IZG9_9ACTN|nr:hypothetical protein [Actinacidiphila rubida]SEN74130.1 hypothetical protein SAMN05216267_100985 [Actinacidiphila rubida]
MVPRRSLPAAADAHAAAPVHCSPAFPAPAGAGGVPPTVTAAGVSGHDRPASADRRFRAHPVPLDPNGTAHPFRQFA